MTSAQEHEILSTSAGTRAQKLLAAGQASLAETELKTLYKGGDDSRKESCWLSHIITIYPLFP